MKELKVKWEGKGFHHFVSKRSVSTRRALQLELETHRGKARSWLPGRREESQPDQTIYEGDLEPCASSTSTILGPRPFTYKHYNMLTDVSKITEDFKHQWCLKHGVLSENKSDTIILYSALGSFTAFVNKWSYLWSRAFNGASMVLQMANQKCGVSRICHELMYNCVFHEQCLHLAPRITFGRELSTRAGGDFHCVNWFTRY